MSEANEAAINGLYESFARADIAAVLSALDEQIDWRSPENLPHGGHFTGRDDVGRFFAGMGEHWENLNVVIDGMFSDDERVIALATATGRLRTGDDAGYTAVHSWTVRDGTPVAFAETVDAPLSLPTAVAAQ